MTTKKVFAELPDSEQEDFISACKVKNLSHKEFEVTMEEEYQTVGYGPISRKATVARQSNGEAKSYPAGNGEAWIVAFEDDLKAGLFN